MQTPGQLKIDPRISGSYNNIIDSQKAAKDKEALENLVRQAAVMQQKIDEWNLEKDSRLKRLLMNEDFNWYVKYIIGPKALYRKKIKKAEMSAEEIYEVCKADVYNDLYYELKGEL